MSREKNEPGSLCIVYLFQHQLKFITVLGNEENSLIDKQSCISFLRTFLVTFETVFTEIVLHAMMKHIKVKYMW